MIILSIIILFIGRATVDLSNATGARAERTGFGWPDGRAYGGRMPGRGGGGGSVVAAVVERTRARRRILSAQARVAGKRARFASVGVSRARRGKMASPVRWPPTDRVRGVRRVDPWRERTHTNHGRRPRRERWRLRKRRVWSSRRATYSIILLYRVFIYIYICYVYLILSFRVANTHGQHTIHIRIYIV